MNASQLLCFFVIQFEVRERVDVKSCECEKNQVIHFKQEQQHIQNVDDQKLNSYRHTFQEHYHHNCNHSKTKYQNYQCKDYQESYLEVESLGALIIDLDKELHLEDIGVQAEEGQKIYFPRILQSSIQNC